MIVHGLEIPILSDTYRVKMARNRLIEIRLTFPVCFLNSAFTSTIGVVTGKDTIFAVHDRGNPVSYTHLKLPTNREVEPPEDMRLTKKTKK